MTHTVRRWPVISALGIVQIFAWGSSYYLMAVLAAPIVADTGWPLPWVVGAISVALACAGMVSPQVGLAVILYGAGNGIFSIARGSLPLALFGADRYPVVMGRLARPSLLAQAAAPMLGGALIAGMGAEGTLTVVACLGMANLVLAMMMWGMIRQRAERPTA